MKLFVCSALLLAVASSSFASNPLPLNVAKGLFGYHAEEPALPEARSVVLNTVTQRVDNFDPQNVDTFEQRYYMNGEHFQPNGPLLVVLSGEWSIRPDRMLDSMPVTVARELFGYVFYLEHRYYGESIPTPNVTTENLRFLTPEQALADTAHFINHIKSNNVIVGAENSPVIVIGLHYSANLATWFRQKYPHLALGAWASSAPLLSVVNHHLYKETAAATYRSLGGNECYNNIEAGFEHIETLIARREIATLSSIFNLCENSPLDTDQKVSAFVSFVAEVFSLVVQRATLASVFGTCRLLERSFETPAHGIAAVMAVLDNNADECVNFDYDALIAAERETALDAIAVTSGVRQYTYQTCTQLGWHHTSDSTNQPFGSTFPLDIFNVACEEIFGAAFSNFTAHQTSDRLNVAHGGLNPAVTNVVFTHGELDPWRTIGVLEDLNESSPAIIIGGASQSQDLPALTENDTQEILDAKRQVKELIRYWIAHDQGIEVVPL